MKHVKTANGIKLFEKQCEGYKCSSRFLISENSKQRFCSKDCKEITSWRKPSGNYKEKFNPAPKKKRKKGVTK